jgi:membrane protease YdiL (CAAX protease family)
MEINASVTDGKKAGFKLFEHPWLAMLAVMLVTVVSIYATAIVVFVILGMPDDKPLGQFLQSISHYLLCTLLLVPFILRLPKGKGSYGKYLEDIGLTRVQPFFRLLLLGLSCSLILMFSQAGATIIYRLFEGIPLNWNFIRQIFDLSGDLPPQSAGLLITIPSMFEELVFRGIVLTTFLNRYSTRNAIIFSSLGFGLMHLLNLANGRDLVWVLGQVAWAFCLGLFYGYIFVSTKSLLPVRGDLLPGHRPYLPDDPLVPVLYFPLAAGWRTAAVGAGPICCYIKSQRIEFVSRCKNVLFY